jgi:hypothetical protein
MRKRHYALPAHYLARTAAYGSPQTDPRPHLLQIRPRTIRCGEFYLPDEIP